MNLNEPLKSAQSRLGSMNCVNTEVFKLIHSAVQHINTTVDKHSNFIKK